VEQCLRFTCGVVGDFVGASWDGVQVRVDWCSSKGGVLWAPSACFLEGNGGNLSFLFAERDLV
jgi:hypothetical protein